MEEKNERKPLATALQLAWRAWGVGVRKSPGQKWNEKIICCDLELGKKLIGFSWSIWKIIALNT